MTCRKCKNVEIIGAVGPAIEQESPTRWILCVPLADRNVPEKALTAEQRAQIGPDDNRLYQK